jgi:uncharacterized protein YhhL (DUF1145 family)
MEALQVKARIMSRIIIILLFLSLPLCFIFSAPSKYTVSLMLIIGFCIYSHTSHAIIYKHLVDKEHIWFGVVKILMFGPLEIKYLMHAKDDLIP